MLRTKIPRLLFCDYCDLHFRLSASYGRKTFCEMSVFKVICHASPLPCYCHTHANLYSRQRLTFNAPSMRKRLLIGKKCLCTMYLAL